MLSKIKQSNSMATEQQRRVSFDQAGGRLSPSAVSEDEDTESTNQDSNNNNNNSSNNNNNNSSKQPVERKRSQEELLDIVEVSRKRRLSKDSADLLDNFIRLSFGHRLADPNSTQLPHLRDSYETLKVAADRQQQQQLETMEDEEEEGEEDLLQMSADDAEDWLQQQQQRHHNQHHSKQISSQTLAAAFGKQFQSPAIEQMLRQQAAKQHQLHSSSSGGGATNLTLVKNEKISSSALLSEVMSSRGIKRTRTSGYMMGDGSPSPTISSTGSGQQARKSSSYLGNVVERLHQQQQKQHQQHHELQHHHHQQQQQQQELQLDQEAAGSNASLSYHLQRFLQQQTSLEDLCSQVGIDDSNQLVLAAAIHRALVDSVGPPSSTSVGGGGGGANNSSSSVDNKSTASSTGSSSGASAGNNNNKNSPMSVSRINQVLNTPSANLNMVDRQRRVYNTRAAMHGSNNQAAAAAAATGSGVPTNLSTSAQQHALGALTGGSISSRVQQQRHAQAAAALSALASVGQSHQQATSHHLHHQQQQPMSSAGGGQPAGGNNQMVDFECDTCGSSFDDRHRLMQHQSIHLELKKDWFTETPVDEVMKIFNRRRGEFLCNTCNLRFEATFDYDKHNHSVHGQRPYCCQFCGNGTRTFRFWRQYLNHLYDHRYIFSCTIDDCDFTVNRRDSLRFHIFRFHLNCQLPQSQQHQLRSVAGAMLGGGGGGGGPESRWPNLDDQQDIDDDDSDMNVG